MLLNVIAWNQAAGMTTLRPTVRRLEGLAGFLRMAFCGMRVLRPAIADTPANHHLFFTEHRFPSHDGLLLHAWHIPAGHANGPDGTGDMQEPEPVSLRKPLIISFNWFGAAKCALLPHIREFHREGWDVFAVDLRGHGGSEGMSTSLGWHEGPDVLAALAYARMHLEPERIILHGVSLGAVAILRAFYLCDLNADWREQAAHPDQTIPDGRVAGLLLEAPFDRLYHTVRHRVATFGVPEWLPLAALMLFWGGIQRGFPAFRHNPCRYAADADVPALILHGQADPFIRNHEARAVAAAIRGAQGTFCEIPGHPHGTALLEHPEAWRKAVLPFVRQLARERYSPAR